MKKFNGKIINVNMSLKKIKMDQSRPYVNAKKLKW